MSVNRLAWIGVAVVVLIVGGLVFRTLRQDTRIRGEPQPVRTAEQTASPAAGAGSTLPSPSSPTQGRREVDASQGSVYRLKAALKAKGYYDGPLDNNVNQTVTDAVKKFQQDAGMRPTGYLDQKTYAALGIEVKKRRP